MSKPIEQQIFKEGSTTYYLSARFFPKNIRRDISRLYSFLRLNDDLVDQEVPQTDKVAEVEKQFKDAMKQQHFDVTTHAWDEMPTRVAKNMVRLTQKYKFDQAWVEDFLTTMKRDKQGLSFHKLEDTLGYVYGSAEVVGLMMAKIMKLPVGSFEAAKLQGRAMQWINFLRDIREDNGLKRRYFPDEDLEKVGLKDLDEQTARDNPEAFKKFVALQLKRYRSWQAEAEAAFTDIPKRLRIPLQTAVDMYNWTANQIEKDPFVVFDHKVKPKKHQVLSRALGKSAVLAAQGARSKIHHLRQMLRKTK